MNKQILGVFLLFALMTASAVFPAATHPINIIVIPQASATTTPPPTLLPSPSFKVRGDPTEIPITAGSSVIDNSLPGSNNNKEGSAEPLPNLPQKYQPNLEESSLSGAGAKIPGKEIPNQYIVVLKEDVDEDEDDDDIPDISSPLEVAADAKSKGAAILHIYENALKGFAVRVPNVIALEAIQKNPNVDYIEQDATVQAFAQTLPRGINRVDGDLSSTRSGNGYGSVNADIAILDTGIYLYHKDLYVYRQKTFVSGTSSANDDNGHGTHVAGIAAAKDNSIGVVGVAPGARLWAIKVLDKYGSGSISTVIKGVDLVTKYASYIEVANMSLGCECKSDALDTALSNSVEAGVAYVVAAGNSGKNAARFSPANHPAVIAVSAIADSDGKCGGKGMFTGYGADDRVASFSNYGSVIDMAAPGVKIYSTYKGGSYTTFSGTSMASPHVAGAAASYMASNSDASPSEVSSSLKKTGSKPLTICDGKGRGYFTGDPDIYPESLLYVRYY